MLFQNLYENLNKKLCKVCNYEPCNWVLSEYTQRIVFGLLKIRSTGDASHASLYVFVYVLCLCSMYMYYVYVYV